MGTNPLITVLEGIHLKPRRLQCDFVRDHSYEVARLASLGLITTAIGGSFGNSWRCTYKGLRVLELGEQE